MNEPNEVVVILILVIPAVGAQAEELADHYPEKK
jgi:hypothetical protein